MSRKKIYLLGLIPAGFAIAHYIFDVGVNPMIVEARHYASLYPDDTDEASRCASADLAAAYYKWGGETAKFEEWKAKANENCGGNFPHAYYLNAPANK